MNEKVILVGAGIAGLGTSLALASRGFDVTVIERDHPPPQGSADTAFFAWQRRGAAQFRHPHAFLGLMCNILEQHYPDLLQDFLTAGARRVSFQDMVPPHLMPDYAPEPGDETMSVLMCRRATMETVLRRYVERQANITIQNETFVTGVQTEPFMGSMKVTGLEITDRSNDNQKSVLEADIFIDTAGRASKFRQWLLAKGATIPEQRDDAEIVYYTRHYQLKPGVDEPDRHQHEPFAGDLGYFKYGVFPGDGGHFAIIVCLPNAEHELRTAIKTGANFDAVCQQIPGLVPWIAADKSTPTTEPFGIGEIHAVWRDYVVDDQPQVLNFFAVADAMARTNPLYGRGCSTGILHGHILAEVLVAQHDPRLRALKFAEMGSNQIRPIFDASLSEDRNGIKRATAVMEGLAKDRARSFKQYLGLAFGDAMAAAARYELHVFRGLMRTVNLVEKPGEFLNNAKIKRTIFRYMLKGRTRNAKARVQRGPDRDTMLAFIDQLPHSSPQPEPTIEPTPAQV